MAQGRVYLNEADHINKYTYKVRVPAYVLRQPEEYLAGEIAPIRSPMRADSEQITRIPIDRMIKLFGSKVPFNVLRHIDIVEIFHHLDLYLMVMAPRIEAMDFQVIEYCRKLIEFRQFWYRRRFLWALNKNPGWKAAYKGEESELTQFLELFPSLGVNKHHLDPIQQLEIPPVQLPARPEQLPEVKPQVQPLQPELPNNSPPPASITPTPYNYSSSGDVEYYPYA